jgi:anaerobic selenocysteine-containing dehydrogenase
MSPKISRRDFLKLSGIGAATTAALTGCGPAARYVVRRPYTEMPEYSANGVSTYYATTCRECSAGCGLIMRTMEGRAIKAEGNPEHPINRGKICSRGLTAVQGLYNPDRIQNPYRNPRRGETAREEVQWEAAIDRVAAALSDTQSGQIAFLLGLAPDHLFDLVTELADTMGAPEPVRYGAMASFDGRKTLLEATEAVYGQTGFPYFDIGEADLVFTFGANFLETWLSPVSYARAYREFRQGRRGRRGHLVAFEPRRSVTSGAADEWFAIVPGTEGLIAQAIGSLLGGNNSAFASVDIEAAAEASGVPVERLEYLAEELRRAERPIVIPGGHAISHTNGLEAAQAILQLNVLLENTGQRGGVLFASAVNEDTPRLSTLLDVQDLIRRMNNGQVQVLFVHGNNPVFELPAALGFTQALANVPLVISFASFPDETSLVSDFVLPDHTGLESWGYQSTLPGADRRIVSASQPVVVPLYNTRSTADVFLTAASGAGVDLGYSDEVDFIQQKLLPLQEENRGTVTGPEILTFWTQWLQHGGWWEEESSLNAGEGQSDTAAEGVEITAPEALPDGYFHLLTFTNHMGDGSGANRPWLQETPDPMTTVTWNSWIEINPHTAEELGIHNDDVVRVISSTGELEVTAYLYPAIRPDSVAIPFGQGHTALGRYAEGRGVNPGGLLVISTNEAGDFAYGDTIVRIEPTGRRRPLARFESITGVYGEH